MEFLGELKTLSQNLKLKGQANGPSLSTDFEQLNEGQIGYVFETLRRWRFEALPFSNPRAPIPMGI
jgi:hypothetical protein